MNTTDTNHDLHEPRARRYAEAIAAAAAADQRVDALVEQIADHEYHRSVAEQQVDALLDRINLGLTELIPATGDAPGPEVQGLIDQADGAAWVRARLHDGTPDGDYWVRADASGNSTRYEWPLESAGPFIPMPDDWALARVNREARKHNETNDELHKMLRAQPGYETHIYLRTPLPEALERVLKAKDDRWIEISRELQALRQAIHDLAREPYDQLEVEAPAGHVELVPVVTVKAVAALLEREA